MAFNLENMDRETYNRPSGLEIDESRLKQIAYEYLCHLEEVRIWLENILEEPIPSATELEERFRNGVLLAKLGSTIAPEVVPFGSIYDPDERTYYHYGLNFRHTENINLWLRSLPIVGFPRIFTPELTDIYEKKNIPKLIKSLHALSIHFFNNGFGPKIQDLVGKVEFSDEVIATISQGLKESGVEIPSFQNVGELSNGVFQSKMENLVTVINEALDQKDSDALKKVLVDSLYCITNVMEENIDDYLEELISTRDCKENNSYLEKEADPESKNKNLTKSEIQECIDAVNGKNVLSQIYSFLRVDKKTCALEILLKNKSCFGEDFHDANGKYYIKELCERIQHSNQINIAVAQGLIADAIQSGNSKAEIDFSNDLVELYDCIREPSKNKTSRLLSILESPLFGVSSLLNKSAARLYLSELSQHLNQKKALNQSVIFNCISLMNIVAVVTVSLEEENMTSAWHALWQLNDRLSNFLELPKNPSPQEIRSYIKELEEERIFADLHSQVLSVLDIYNGIYVVKKQKGLLTEEFAKKIFDAVRRNDEALFCSFDFPFIVKEADKSLFFYLLTNGLRRAEMRGEVVDSSDVWRIWRKMNFYTERIRAKISYLTTFSLAVEECQYQNIDGFLEELTIPFTTDVRLLTHYLRDHIRSLKRKNPFIVFEYDIGEIRMYVNVDEGLYWLKPPAGAEITPCLMSESIRSFIRQLSFINLDDVLDSVIRIQSFIRGSLVRIRHKRLRNATIKIQRWWRRTSLLLDKANDKKSLDSYLFHISQVKKTQQLWRKEQKRKASRETSPESVHSKPKLELKCDEHDATEDLIEMLRSQVMESIKKNEDLAKKVEDMDIKIGLLVRNKISILSLIAERKNQKVLTGNESKGIKALSKEAKKSLDCYQKLFYRLQTQPVYLSRLICTGQTSPIIQSFIFNVFNHGASPRDEYLLLHLFAYALKEEVVTKFQSATDAIKGNFFILKLAIGYARQSAGLNPLKNILAPLIYDVINSVTAVDTNPVDIYRRWINETELTSGCQSSLPRTVTQEIALTYSEVVRRLEINIQLLQVWVNKFLTRLSENIKLLPYVVKFIAKSLHDVLLQKFINLKEKDVLKIIGHLIYYQYINSAIVAPDAFHIISLSAEKPLRVEQRKNLANVAKLLQFSASKTGFGEESKHLMQLNPFIIKCHEVMKEICLKCCAVPSLEDHYQFNEFSEALLMERPKVYMTASELCEAHQLLLSKRQVIAEPEDPINGLILDLGSTPTPADLLGYSSDMATNPHVGRALICLGLDSEHLTQTERKKAKATELKLRREAQTRELHELKLTLSRLEEKTKYYEDQLAYYETYLNTCLKNQMSSATSKSQKTVKYTGTQLSEKGILVSLESLPVRQYKHLQFDISSLPTAGVFSVRCKFMGVEVDSTEIDIQHLLSLQFEGCGIMKMFGKAEINVNLLLFLLNKKFIGLNSKK